jgi:predicted nucleotide-binding protein
MNPDRRVFLLYAREDGEEIANRIRERVEGEHPDLELWQDLVKLLGGKGWLGQILEAIEKSQYLVMVMTPEAQRSATVQKEWRHARHNGVCVIPVRWEDGPRPDFETVHSLRLKEESSWATHAT